MQWIWLTTRCVLLYVVSGAHFNGFKVRWGNVQNAYLPLPWSSSEAGLGSLWRRAGYDSQLRVHLVSHIEDPRFFLLFDKQNTIAGVMFGFVKNDVNRVMMQDNQHNYTFPHSMYRSANIWDKDIWITPVLFTHPDVLKAGGRTNLDSSSDELVADLYYWTDSAWQLAPQSECSVTSDLVEQGCYPGMGKHYYFKTDDNTPCDQWQGFFATYDQGQLSGFGVTVFGSFLSTYYTTTYYEYPTFPVIKSILKHRAECVDEWLPFTGVTSVHVFLTQEAEYILCPETDSKSGNCTQSGAQNPDGPSVIDDFLHAWRSTIISSRANPRLEPYKTTTTICTSLLLYYILYHTLTYNIW